MAYKEKHGRDYAISELNRWFDEIGISDESKIDTSLTIEQQTEIESFKQSRLTEISEIVSSIKDDSEKKIKESELLKELENEVQIKIESFDYVREKLIKALQKESIIITGEGLCKFNLKYPIEDTKGNILVKELIFKNRIKEIDLNKNSVKDDMDNRMGLIKAMLAARTGVSRGLISQLDLVEYEMCGLIISVFQRAD